MRFAGWAQLYGDNDDYFKIVYDYTYMEYF